MKKQVIFLRASLEHRGAIKQRRLCILNDALEALRNSIYDFLRLVATVLHYYCNKKKDVKYTGLVICVITGNSDNLGAFVQVGNFWIQCTIDAEIAFVNLIFHLVVDEQRQMKKRLIKRRC